MLVLISSPLYLIMLNINYPDTHNKLIFSIFAFFLTIERIWETFYTSKEKEVRNDTKDFTLLTTSIMYFVVGILAIFEFFYFDRNLISISIVGLVIFVLSGLLRYISVKTLGDQWAINAVGESRLESGKHQLIINGPYKYIRHPIYLATMFELLGVILFFNAFYSILVFIFINVPLYIQRAIYEEKTSMNRFGNDYRKYKEFTSFMFPFKFLKNLKGKNN